MIRAIADGTQLSEIQEPSEILWVFINKELSDEELEIIRAGIFVRDVNENVIDVLTDEQILMVVFEDGAGNEDIRIIEEVLAENGVGVVGWQTFGESGVDLGLIVLSGVLVGGLVIWHRRGGNNAH